VAAPPLDRLVSIDSVDPRREPAYTVVSDEVELSLLSSITGENTSGDMTSCDVTDDVTSSTMMRHVSDSAALLDVSPITVDLHQRHRKTPVQSVYSTSITASTTTVFQCDNLHLCADVGSRGINRISLLDSAALNAYKNGSACDETCDIVITILMYLNFGK